MSVDKLDKNIQEAFVKFETAFNKIPHSPKDPGELSDLQRIATLLMVKTMRTTKALYELWRAGMAEDMQTLSRGVIETYVTLRFLKDHGDEADSKRFLARGAVKVWKQAETMIRLFPKSRSAESLKPQLHELREQGQHAKETYLKGEGRAPKISDWADNIGFHEFQVIYPDFSGHSHPDAASSSSYIPLTEEGWEPKLDDPDHESAANVASLSLMFIVEVIIDYAKIMELEYPEDDFREVYDVSREPADHSKDQQP